MFDETGPEPVRAMNETIENTETTRERPARVVPYDLIGGADVLRRVVDRFYQIMDSDPAAATIRAMHAEDLAPVSERLFEFLSGWLGGPSLYVQRTGSVCITEPHQPFAIGEAERDVWLLCMRRALVEEGISEEVRQMLDQPLFMIADTVRNR
jgi:hemoglobin